jgi:hypothetical protein
MPITKAELKTELAHKIEAEAQELIESVHNYIDYIWGGGDERKYPNGSSYNNPLSRFVGMVVNAHRIEIGKVQNPFHPMTSPFVLFDMLHAELGEWVPAARLRAKISNYQVTATFGFRETEILKAAGSSLKSRQSRLPPIAWWRRNEQAQVEEPKHFSYRPRGEVCGRGRRSSRCNC